MRSAVLACAAVVLGLCAAPASSSPFKGADDYYYVRDRAKTVERFAPDEIQSQPQKFEGELLEVRGLISAIAGSDAQTTLLIDANNGTPPVLITLAPDQKVTNWPFLDVGTSIRALCKVVQAG